MNWSKPALFASGIFFGGAVDHVILAAMGSETTPFGVRAGVAGNWAFAVFDLGIAAALYVWHQKLAHVAPASIGVERPGPFQTGDVLMAHQQHQSCIEACVRCAQACEHCASACLSERDVAKMAECVRLDRDCAEICWTAAAYMSRGSKFSSAICRVCAEVCDACGAECAKHQVEHCQRCAEACRGCAGECRKMAGAKS